MKCLLCFSLTLMVSAVPSPSTGDPLDSLARIYDYSDSIPLDRRDSLIVDSSTFRVYDLTYQSPKSGRVTSYLVVPKASGKVAGIVFSHWGYGTRTEFLPEAILYAKAGVASILPDDPWVRPAPWRRNLGNFTQPDSDYVVYAQAVVDLRRAIDLLLCLPGIDSSRIGFVGHSYGAQFGCVLAAIDRRIKAAAIVGGVPAMRDIYVDSDDPDMVGLRQAVPADTLQQYVNRLSAFDAINYVTRTSPTPMLYQFAYYERYYGMASMRRLEKAAAEPKAVLWYHSGHDLNDVQTLVDRANWLQQHLRFDSVTPTLKSIIK